jgi:hypothetical protein
MLVGKVVLFGLAFVGNDEIGVFDRANKELASAIGAD